MIRLHAMLAVLFCLLSGNIVAAADAKKDDGVWVDSWDKAVEASKAYKKPILADFTGSDWCYWCQKLDKEVFTTKAFQDWAAKNVILLKVDFPKKTAQDAAVRKHNADLARKYKIEGYPTVLIIDADGNSLIKTGYQEGGPDKWTAAVDKALKR